LTDVVNRNNAWMLEAGGSFRFTTETFHMRFGGPISQADHFQCYRAVETFLPGSVNHTLTAASDFLQQLIIAKIAEPACGSCRFLCIRRLWAITNAGVTDPGYRFFGEQTKPGLEQTCGAKFLRPFSENLRATFCASSGDSRHDVDWAATVSIRLCRKFLRSLRPQNSN